MHSECVFYIRQVNRVYTGKYTAFIFVCLSVCAPNNFLDMNISKMVGYRGSVSGPPVGNGIMRRIEWSRDRQRHLILKGMS